MAPSTFTGPWATSLDQFQKSLASMPPQYQEAFATLSTSTRATMCDKTVLHVWETDSDLANLLQLAQVIVKVRSLTTYIPQASGNGAAQSVPAGMIILTHNGPGRDNFGRVCELVQHIMETKGRSHLNGGVRSFGGIKVVRGVNNTHTPDPKTGNYTDRETETEARKAVERVNKAITRVFESGAYPIRKLIWHQGPVIHFLSFWINNTTQSLRSSVAGISVCGILDFSPTNSSASSTTPPIHLPPIPSTVKNGTYNQTPDLHRLHTYARKLSIPVLLLSASALHITHQNLATYMYFYSYYIHTLLPRSVLSAHKNLAYDALISYSYRLYSAVLQTQKPTSFTPKAIPAAIKRHLTPTHASPWTRACLRPETYADKQVNQNTIRDNQIFTALQLADAPLLPFKFGPEAFARLMTGPAAEGMVEHYAAVPIDLSPSSSTEGNEDWKMRVSNSGPFHVYLPTSTGAQPDCTHAQSEVEKATARIQGMMIGVLQLVRQGKKGTPDIAPEDRAVWEEVSQACAWALGECKGKLPKGVEEKVVYVVKALKGGTWAWCLGTGDASALLGQGEGGWQHGPKAAEGGAGQWGQGGGDGWTGGGGGGWS
ncbi:hypothetical protein M011DRAFT_488830 [Sporormia fimetaria CBS 119925]|uniref:Uncharacterized protein n=1 Tax=Sporormia fimetaria CBS 119925 TaxID=1340428 RepID=A0A6A6V5L0_9PLEO|nr:hypothetical protein M011DRAFT_488830 [Sporormia fimetaria CBS 119925]